MKPNKICLKRIFITPHVQYTHKLQNKVFCGRPENAISRLLAMPVAYASFTEVHHRNCSSNTRGENKSETKYSVFNTIALHDCYHGELKTEQNL